MANIFDSADNELQRDQQNATFMNTMDQRLGINPASDRSLAQKLLDSTSFIDSLDPLGGHTPYEQRNGFQRFVRRFVPTLVRGMVDAPFMLNALGGEVADVLGVPGADKYASAASRLAQSVDENVRAYTGIPQNDTPNERLFDLGVQLLAPVKGVEAVVGPVTQGGKLAAKIVDALVTPGLQHPTIPNATVAAGVGTALDQLNRFSNGEPNVIDALNPFGTAHAAEPTPGEQYQTMPTSKVQGDTNNSIFQDAEEDLYQQRRPQDTMPQGKSIFDDVDNSMVQPTAEPKVDPTTLRHHATALVVGGLAAAYFLRKVPKQVYKYFNDTPKPAIGEQLPQTSSTSVKTAIKKGFVDSEAPLYENLSANNPNRDEVLNRLAVQTRQGAETSAFEAIKTGQAPGASPVSTYPFARLKVDYDNAGPHRQTLIEEGITARTLLDQIRNATFKARSGQFVTPHDVKDPLTGQRYTVQQLNQMEQDARNDPFVQQFMHRFDQIMAGIGEHAVQRNVLSYSTLLDWRRANPGFAHLADVADANVPWVERLKNMLGGDTNVANEAEKSALFAKRALEEQSGVRAPLNVMQSAEQYIMQSYAYIEKTNALNYALRQLETDPLTSNFVKRVKRSSDGNFSTYMGGKKVYYNITDDHILNALQLGPYHVLPIMNGLRRFWSSTVVGKLRPYFAIGKAWLYDAVGAAAMREDGMALSLIDNSLQNVSNGRFTAGSVLSPVDPTVYISALIGSGKHFVQNTEATLSHQLYRQMAKNGLFAQALGQQRLRDWSDRLASRYLSSILHQVNRYGGVDASLYKEAVDGITSYIKKLEGHPVGSIYGNLLEAFHTGVRLQMVDLSKGRVPMRDAVAMARRAVGDVTRKGSNKHFSILTSSIPFLNTATQETARFAEWINKHPMRALTTIIFGVMVPKMLETLLWSSDDRYRKQYHTYIPDYVRATSFLVPNPTSGNPNDYYALWMNPLLAPFGAIASDAITDFLQLREGGSGLYGNAIKQFFGINNTPVTDPRIVAGMSEADKYHNTLIALSGALVPPLPPLYNALNTYLLGQNVRSLSLAPGESGQPIHHDLSTGIFDGGRVMNDIMPAELQAVLNSIAGTLANTIIESTREAQFGLERDGAEGMFQNLGQLFKINTERAMPYIFSGAIRETTNAPLSQMLQRKSQGIDALSKGFNNVFSQSQQRGAGVRPLPEGDAPAFTSDPNVIKAMSIIRNFQSSIARRRLLINDTRSSIARVQGSATMSREQREKMVRELTRTEEDQTEALLSLVRSIEDVVSAQVPALAPFRLEDYATAKRR